MLKRSTLFQSLVLTLILSLGFGIFWSMAVAWVWQIAEEVVNASAVRENLQFLEDGTPVVQYYLSNRYAAWQYRDLEGRPLDLGMDVHQLTVLSLAGSTHEGDTPGRIGWEHRLRPFSDQHQPAQFWFFVTDGRAEGRAYFVGYDSLTNIRTGFVGTKGFRTDPLPAEEQFPFDGQAGGAIYHRVQGLQYSYGARYPYSYADRQLPGSLSLWTVFVQTRDQKVYRVDLSKRSVDVVSEQPTLRSIGLERAAGSVPTAELHRLVVRLEDEIQTRDSNNQVLKRFRIPEELRSKSLAYCETSRGEAILYTTSLPDVLDADIRYRIYWIDPAGRITRQAEPALRYRNSPQALRVVGGVLLPVPLLMDLGVGLARPFGLVLEGYETNWGAALTRALVEFWPSLLIAQLVGAVLAWRCYRRQVLYAAGGKERWLWPTFVFLFGLPGWIGYRYSRSWPMLERCAECGAVVPQDRTHCAACQADFPLPALKGTEVFA